MANKSNNTAPVPAPVVSAAATIRKMLETKVLPAFATKQNAIVKADAALDEAKEEGLKARPALLAMLGQAAVDGDWLMEDIKEGLKAACDGLKHQPTSLATFRSQMMRAVDPHVRAKVTDIFKIAKAAWDKESNADGPVRTLYKREYHTAIAIMGQVIEDKGKVPTAAAVAAAAQTTLDKRPADPRRAAAALKSMMKKLEGMAEEFPHDDILSMIEFCKGIKPKDMQACHDEMVAAQEAAASAATAAKNGKAAPAKRAMTRGKPKADVDTAVEDILGDA